MLDHYILLILVFLLLVGMSYLKIQDIIYDYKRKKELKNNK